MSNTLIIYRNTAQIAPLKEVNVGTLYFPFDGDVTLLEGMDYSDVLYLGTSKITPLATVQAIEANCNRGGVTVEPTPVTDEKPKRKRRARKEQRGVNYE